MVFLGYEINLSDYKWWILIEFLKSKTMISISVLVLQKHQTSLISPNIDKGFKICYK